MPLHVCNHMRKDRFFQDVIEEIVFRDEATGHQGKGWYAYANGFSTRIYFCPWCGERLPEITSRP